LFPTICKSNSENIKKQAVKKDSHKRAAIIAKEKQTEQHSLFLQHPLLLTMPVLVLPVTIDVANSKCAWKKEPKSDAKADDVDQESPIFSTVGSPDDVDATTGDELGDYELSYLHNLYQGDMHDAMLPETEAPTSLGLMSLAPLSVGSGPASSLKPLALSVLGLKNLASSARVVSQPDTPPTDSHDSWGDADDDEDEDADEDNWKRCKSPLPNGLETKHAVVRDVVNSRKRKATPADDMTSRAKESKMDKNRACTPVHVDSSSSSRESSETPSNRPMLDGMEIRPEDDPLGLFSRDPATLTPEEQRLLKKQRRLLKNRESAQLSRHRKKCHLHTLEKQVDALKKEKAVLAQRVQALVDENARLRKGV